MLHIIGGKFKKRALATPKTKSVRPTTSQLRETFFNICQLTIEGSSFLDLFAGSGAMGLEALSRGAKEALFVEKGREALFCLKQNIETLGVEQQSRVFGAGIWQALERLSTNHEAFDLIYADPPYGEGFGLGLLKFIDEHSGLLKKEGSLFIEETKLHMPPLEHLKLVKERKAGRANLYHFTHL